LASLSRTSQRRIRSKTAPQRKPQFSLGETDGAGVITCFPLQESALNQTWLFGLFGVVVLGLLALDLGLFHKRDREIKFREALIWSSFWTGLALAFNSLILLNLGRDAALTFLTAYIVELSLSVDNLFVFLLIFSAFRVAPRLQHRVLFWGILGALLMRAVCIGA